jgi:hypothetical protein
MQQAATGSGSEKKKNQLVEHSSSQMTVTFCLHYPPFGENRLFE